MATKIFQPSSRASGFLYVEDMEPYERPGVPHFNGPLTSAVSASPEQGNPPGGPATQKTLIKTFIKRFKWYYLFAACIIITLLVVVIVISVYYSKRNTEENVSCLTSINRVKVDDRQDADFLALIVFFWPWSPDMEDTNSPMYEETISKAEYWVTEIFQASFLSSCIRSAATEMMGLGGNILVRFVLHVSCDTATEIEVNKAYIEGHLLLHRTQDKSRVVSISKHIYLKKLNKKIPTSVAVPPSEIPGKGHADTNVSCPPSPPRVKLDYNQGADFEALILFFWPWSRDMKNTNSPMYEETISKAEYWVTKIFQTSSLFSCIRPAATKLIDQGGNILVHFKLYVSCDNAAEVEINRAYIEGHLLLQRTQDRSCVVSIGQDIHLQQLSNTISSKDPDYPSKINDTICGQSQMYSVPKIMGGRPVKRGEYPWVVKLLISTDKITLCGGTIWDYNHILTAAHCIAMLPMDNSTGLVDSQGISVIAGKWETLIPSRNEQYRRVKSVRIHKDFKGKIGNIANDIALLKLAKPLHPTQLVMKVCHPDASIQLPNKGIVAGWGRTKVEPKTFPEVQQSVEQTLLNASDCMKLMTLQGYWIHLTDGTLCSVNDELEGKSACMGDSGSPLFANVGTGGDERYTIFGIVSHGMACGRSPTVHTSVPHYLEWIQSTIQMLQHL
ncbi:transmembrane protease serine 11F-like isoform X1 [Pomacea canaliculata]|uniref:transmembrane protease serine 11F-like isoform X1 n=1 Tax=Pomacea canaliculata TaxID=400727 RepID=UPI000D734577|nr:transmembrane protease serine 11F-like isoform X1 [Pomacea canaliculata]XP_025091845.1 transmembrane protease serine 11F-like isoform X1 [Pomacea canaliculata]